MFNFVVGHILLAKIVYLHTLNTVKIHEGSNRRSRELEFNSVLLTKISINA